MDIYGVNITDICLVRCCWLLQIAQFAQRGGCKKEEAFGSWTKEFGTGPAGIIQAEIVTGNGRVVVATEHQNEDFVCFLI